MTVDRSTQLQRKLAEVLTEARKQAGISQQVLAKRLSKPQPFVSRYEIGQKRVEVVELLEICDALGVNASDILTKIQKS